MNKIVYVADIKSFDGTHFNDAPVGLREITEEDFAKGPFFHMCPTHTEYKQITRGRKGKCVLDLHIFWFQDKTGIAMSADFWKGKVTYWACGCDHKYKELSYDECKERKISHHGMCWHVKECQICKHVTSYDSGD